MNTIQHTEPTTDTTSSAAISDAEPTVVIDTPRRDPVWRVVGGSISAGFLGAIVLTLGVFGGAAEHIISGSALLAFAGGWAMLALLSARFTSQPQRWARVPAVSMAAAGLTLLIAQPDDQALNILMLEVRCYLGRTNARMFGNTYTLSPMKYGYRLDTFRQAFERTP